MKISHLVGTQRVRTILQVLRPLMSSGVRLWGAWQDVVNIGVFQRKGSDEVGRLLMILKLTELK